MEVGEARDELAGEPLSVANLYAAVGEAAAVAQPLDRQLGGPILRDGAQEVGVKGVERDLRTLGGREQGAAERDPAEAVGGRLEAVLAHRSELEDLREGT
jgi:hypothetical protein